MQYDAITLLNDPEARCRAENPERDGPAHAACSSAATARSARAVDVAVALTAPAADRVAPRRGGRADAFDVPVKQLAAVRHDGDRGDRRARLARADRREDHRDRRGQRARRRRSASCRSGSGGSTWPPVRTPTSATPTSSRSAPSGTARTSTRPSTCRTHFPDFRWNMEVAWQAENYVHSRSGRAAGRLLSLRPRGQDRHPGPVLQHADRALLARKRPAG